jgi:GT2 family glycosyltransferase
MSRLSVIIPTHNRAELLPAAIQSVLSQSLADLELIIVDDGSTDATPAAIADFADGRLRVIRQEQAGGPAARNRGWRESRSPYLLLLDSDDTLLPGALAALMAAAEAQPEAGLIGGDFIYVDEAGRHLGESRAWRRSERLDLARWVKDCPFIPSATLIRADWYGRVGGFDPALGASQDWDLWLRLAAADCPMAWLRQPVAQYRQHSGALSADPERTRRNALRALDQIFERPGLPADTLAARDEAYALVYARCAARQIAAAHFAPAAANLLQAHDYLGQPAGAERALEMTLRIGQALRPPIDLAAFEQALFGYLPPALRQPGLRRRVAARLAAAELFTAYQQRDWPRSRHSWWSALAHDPKWLANRGFLVIGLRSWWALLAPGRP